MNADDQIHQRLRLLELLNEAAVHRHELVDVLAQSQDAASARRLVSELLNASDEEARVVLQATMYRLVGIEYVSAREAEINALRRDANEA